MSIATERPETMLSPEDDALRQRINQMVLWCACVLGGGLGLAVLHQVPRGAWGTFLVAAPAALLIGLPLATVLHEGTHALALRSLGYHVRLRFTSFYPPLASVELNALYFVAWRMIVGTLVPVVVLTAVATLLVLSAIHWFVSLLALVVLVTNMLGSATDVCVAVFLARLPRSSILLPFDLPSK